MCIPDILNKHVSIVLTIKSQECQVKAYQARNNHRTQPEQAAEGQLVLSVLPRN